MEIGLFVNWLCVEAQHCQDTGDISNVFSTIVGTVVGILIGGGISWWIYNRQKKISEKQDGLLTHIEELEEKHEKILKMIQVFERNNEKLLKNIFALERKIDVLLQSKKDT